VSAKLASPEELAEAVNALLAERGRVLLALDGRCASGKTTLAGRLRERYGWAVVHLDHFFLRPEQRTPRRYAEPGGNVDRERFLAEVLLPLREGRQVRYRPFDCGTQTLGEPVAVDPAPVTVAEGAYACHPDLWDCYDLRACLTVAPAEQARRLLARNGPEGAARFREKWVPLEEAYLSAFRIEARCDYLLKL